jgi:hypothetical protein
MWLNHLPFSNANFAPAFEQWSKENLDISSSIGMTSVSSPGFHPSNARKFTTA